MLKKSKREEMKPIVIICRMYPNMPKRLSLEHVILIKVITAVFFPYVLVLSFSLLEHISIQTSHVSSAQCSYVANDYHIRKYSSRDFH